MYKMNYFAVINREYERDWHVKIEDAVLEKCGPAHGIVHIAVQKTSQEVIFQRS